VVLELSCDFLDLEIPDIFLRGNKHRAFRWPMVTKHYQARHHLELDCALHREHNSKDADYTPLPRGCSSCCAGIQRHISVLVILEFCVCPHSRTIERSEKSCLLTNRRNSSPSSISIPNNTLQSRSQALRAAEYALRTCESDVYIFISQPSTSNQEVGQYSPFLSSLVKDGGVVNEVLGMNGGE